MARITRIATAAYSPTWIHSIPDYIAKTEHWLRQAAGEGAALVVFPEYGAMELASLDGTAVAGDLARSLAAVAGRDQMIRDVFSELASKYRLHILAPSGPVQRTDGQYVNRSLLFTPGGLVGEQQKLMMTRFEREHWHVSAGAGVKVFATALGRIGVQICYDSEFPLASRAMAAAGAEILLVPSCTDTVAGYNRVRVGAQARALEGQMVTVVSPLSGPAPWSPAIDVNRGRAGVFAPPDLGFPDDGVVAIGELDAPGLIYASVDLDQVAEVRRAGQVLNHRHWGEQPGATPLKAEIVPL